MSDDVLARADVAPPRPGRRTWALLATLTVLVAALHLVGIGWHLPHRPQGDEKVFWLQVRIARGHEVAPLELEFARSYPLLLGRIADLVVPRPDETPPRDLAELRASAVEELLGIRILFAILSAAIVPATFFAARWILRDRWALLAAGLASISTLGVWYASQARPHPILAALTTATVAASLRARASGRIADFLLAGTFAALATATLQSGICACAVIAAAWWWNARPRFGAPLVGASVAAALVVASVVAFLGGGPRNAADGAHPATGGLLSALSLDRHPFDLESFHGGGFVRFATALRDYEPALAILAGVGCIVVVGRVLRGRGDRARRAVVATACAHPLLHLLVFGAYSDSFQRMWLPLIPTLATLAALAIGSVDARAPERGLRSARIAVGALVLVQIAIATKIAVLRVRDDTHELAARWIVEHPAEAPFQVGPSIQLPLVPADPAFRAELEGHKFFLPWSAATAAIDPALRRELGVDLRDPPARRNADRERLEQDPAAWIAGLGPGTFLLENYRGNRRPAFRALRAELQRRGPAIARFDPLPLDVPGTNPIDYGLDSTFAPEDWIAWSILWASRLGPDVEAYALAR